MDIFAQAASSIIKSQLSIIGPIAFDQAKKVSGLQVVSVDNIQIQGDKKEVLDHLVRQFAKLFGKASIEVCKEAFGPYSSKIPANQIPDILKN